MSGSRGVRFRALSLLLSLVLVSGLVAPGAAAALTGDYRIDALMGGRGLPGDQTVHYSFYSAALWGSTLPGDHSQEYTALHEMTATDRDLVRTMLAYYETFLDVRFAEVQQSPSDVGDLEFAKADLVNGGGKVSGHDMGLPGVAPIPLVLVPNYNGVDLWTVNHEFGHALGMVHGFQLALEDWASNHMMSFKGTSVMPMAYDVLALRHYYGTRLKATGADVYTFGATYDRFTNPWVQAYSSPVVGTITEMSAIIDDGGVDTLDMSALPADAAGYRFELRGGGTLSQTSQYSVEQSPHIWRGTTLAFSTVIENLVVSSSSDLVYANSAANTFSGYAAGRRAGDDVYNDTSGNDTLDLSGYANADVTRVREGDDLVLGLGTDGSIRIVGYYAGNALSVLYADATVPGAHAAFTSSASGGIAPLAITFDAGASAAGTPITGYLWDFGDGTIGSGQVVTHTFQAPGSYTVRLLVTDASGAASAATTTVTVVANQAPVAASIVSTSTAKVPFVARFDASGSSDADGSIVSYAWDFGDGTAGAGIQTSHTYTTPGVYTTTLTVTDDRGARTSVAQSVTALLSWRPTAVIAPDRPTIGMLDPVTFGGAESFDSDGTIVSYTWDFGDGTTATGVGAAHAWAAPGTYPVRLTVTDNAGMTGTATLNYVVQANRFPVPVLTVTPTTGPGPLTVTFDGAKSYDPDGSIMFAAIDFGDGASSWTASDIHTYANPGTYTATLMIWDNNWDIWTKQVTITVLPPNQAPTAVLTPPAAVVAGTAATFSAAGSVDPDGRIASYAWTWGDGTSLTSTLPTASKTYTKTGTYTVTLKVTDDKGATTTTTKMVTVLPKAVHVGGITLVQATSGTNRSVKAVVTLLDAANRSIGNVTVRGAFGGLVVSSATAKSSTGTVTLTSGTTTKTGAVTFTITGITPPAGYTYDTKANVVTSGTITLK